MIYTLVTLIAICYIGFVLKSKNKDFSQMHSLLRSSFMLVLIFTVATEFGQVFSLFSVPMFLNLWIRFMLIFESFFFINLSFYLVSSSIEKYAQKLNKIRILFYIFSLYCVFFRIEYHLNLNYFQVIAPFWKLLNSETTDEFGIAIRNFVFLFKVLMPSCACLIILLNSLKNILKFQNAILNILAIVVLWASGLWIFKACQYQSSFIVFIIPFYISILILLCKIEKIKSILKFRFMVIDGIASFLRFILPALLCAIMYIPARNLYLKEKYSGLIFYSFYVLVIVTLARWLNDNFRLRTSTFARRYRDEFELRLSALDYKINPKLLTEQLYSLFHEYVSLSSMIIAIANDVDQMKIAYSTEKTPITVLKKDIELFDFLIDANREVVFESDIGIDIRLKDKYTALISLFRRAHCEGLIVLHEGARITGVFLLGKKMNGFHYNSYDRRVLTDLYSFFFVFTYFMQNVMNKSLVGVFDREVKLSSQIITSIQQNMDFPSPQKIDCAYQLFAGHEIGGEFVDMFSLSEKKHFFVIGSLSGKGVSASMNMVILKTTIRTLIPKFRDLKSFAEKLNSVIYKNLPKETFFSGLLLTVDFESGLMKYVNCGIPAFMLYSKSIDNVVDIQGKGCVLGIEENISSRISIKEQRMEKGYIVFACTSGIIESRSLRGERFGKTRIRHCIAERCENSADQILRHIKSQHSLFMSDLVTNDITMLLLER